MTFIDLLYAWYIMGGIPGQGGGMGRSDGHYPLLSQEDYAWLVRVGATLCTTPVDDDMAWRLRSGAKVHRVTAHTFQAGRRIYHFGGLQDEQGRPVGKGWSKSGVRAYFTAMNVEGFHEVTCA
jgi:hypothetical protein